MRVSQSSGGWETQAQGAASLVSGDPLAPRSQALGPLHLCGGKLGLPVGVWVSASQLCPLRPTRQESEPHVIITGDQENLWGPEGECGQRPDPSQCS